MSSLKSFAKRAVVLLLLACCSMAFCSPKRSSKKQTAVRPLMLSSVHIADHNGLVEAITGKDRLNQLENVNFLQPQPYQKVLRIYERDPEGNIFSIVTSYYDNGNIKQYLEILNGRAHGKYHEWHSNGQMSVMVSVIGGVPDITPEAEKSWLFDGCSYAWDESGHLSAQIPYSQGTLDGLSLHYHSNGVIWKKIPFCKNEIEGLVEIFRKNGEILLQARFCQNVQHGTSLRYWCPNQIASQEEFCKGRLENGSYYDQKGQLISEIKDGTGFRAAFGKEGIHELQEYAEGKLEGEVKVFNSRGEISRIYHIKNGRKHGEELSYFENTKSRQLQLSLQWHEGEMTGQVKTWYINGTQESQREIAKNAKNGVAMAWYRDGNLMLMEEYENNKLMRGDYFKKGERNAISKIRDGNGVATIYDAEGHFVQKINYVNSRPERK